MLAFSKFVLCAVIIFSLSWQNAYGQQPDTPELNPYPIDPEELDMLGQLGRSMDYVNFVIEELIFYSFVSALPLHASTQSMGPNKIGLMAPNPYIRLSLTGGLQTIVPIVNFDVLRTANTRGLDFGPLRLLSNNSGKYSTSLVSAMIFFSLRFQLTLGIDILDNFQFGITYGAPQISTGFLTSAIGNTIGLPYSTKVTLYGLNVRYMLVDDPIANVAIGTSFSRIEQSFRAENTVNNVNLNLFRTRRSQDLATEDDSSYPIMGPYTASLAYVLESDYKMSALDLFFRTDFGVPLFRPFLDFGLTVNMSEILIHNNSYVFLITEPQSITPGVTVPSGRYQDFAATADANIRLRDVYVYSTRKSGVSLITPRLSVGFNALYILNFHASISFLRAENPIPAFSLTVYVNLDF